MIQTGVTMKVLLKKWPTFYVFSSKSR